MKKKIKLKVWSGVKTIGGLFLVAVFVYTFELAWLSLTLAAKQQAYLAGIAQASCNQNSQTEHTSLIIPDNND